MEKNNNIRLYSFDIFDTLLTRTTGVPSGIFALVQNTLKYDKNYSDLPLLLKENFYTIRTGAEAFIRENRRNYKINEITIKEIYDFIKDNNFLTEEQNERLLNLEL